MLAEIRIQNLGVIEDAVLELHPGFTVVTGETGAGKTMVISGLHLLSGGRADVSRIRSGADRALVEGRFSGIESAVTKTVVDEIGAQLDEDDSLIVARSVNADGRSRAHLGARSVPAGALADLAELVLAVHGQNDQLRLLRPAEQRAVLDRFAGSAVLLPLERYRAIRQEWLDIRRDIDERARRSRELSQQADLLQHGLTEIAAVSPQPGEDGELSQRINKMGAVEELRAAANAAVSAISGATDDESISGALSLLTEAGRALAIVEDAELVDIRTRLTEISTLLSDIDSDLVRYIDSLNADPDELEKALNRQSELKKLTKKYAADIDGVLAWVDEAQQRLSTMDTSEEAMAALVAQRDELAKQLGEHASAVTAARRSAAKKLSSAITAELSSLAMGQAVIDIQVTLRQTDQSTDYALKIKNKTVYAGVDGVDDVELVMRAHSGASALPVHKAASGGELSRVMLAMEVVLAHADTVQTLVFDEVDAGVGGRAAVEIGRRLARLAQSHQVVVVTHLPQVAAYADRHVMVDKSASGAGHGIIHSGICTLSESDRVAELARMLAGLDETETGRAHAEELLATAAADRASNSSRSVRRG